MELAFSLIVVLKPKISGRSYILVVPIWRT